jgi:hypothetical protein
VAKHIHAPLGGAATKDTREQQARDAVRRARRNVTWLFSEQENRRFFRRHLEVADIDLLVAAAWEGDKDAFEFLRNYARGARQHPNMHVPPDFHALVWECFIDGPPKAKPGTSSKDTDLTYQTIAILVRMVNRDYGFPLHNSSVTAISIVADELEMSESRVLKIWEAWGKATAQIRPAKPLPRN